MHRDWSGTALAIRARAALGSLARLVVDVALPPTCLACRTPVADDGGLCAACWAELPFITRPFCDRLGTPFPIDLGPDMLSPEAAVAPPAWGRARAVARYEGTASALVHALKFADRLELATPMGRLMAAAGVELLDECDALVPVPLHWTRLWRRRFNQSSLLANGIACRVRLPVRDGWLRRCRATGHQIGRDRDSRAQNVQGAFAVPEATRADLRDRRLVLVDDVMTSGATAESAARALLRAGARSVDVLVFARVVTQA